MSHRFGPVRQVAYLVNDIEQAMKHWTEVLGVGPFFYLARITAHGSTFRGKPTAPELSIAFSQSGAVQIEIIQQHNDAPSQFTGCPEGQHHVAFWTKDFDRDLDRYFGEGFEILSTAQQAPNRNCFLIGKMSAQGHPGTLIEISEIAGEKGRFFERIAEIAAAWDGKDPVRRVSRMSPEAL